MASFAPPAAGGLDEDGQAVLNNYQNSRDCFGGPDVPPADTCPEGVGADFENDDADLIDLQGFHAGLA